MIIDVEEAKSTIVQDMDGIQQQIGIPTVHIDATAATMADAYRMLGKLLGLRDQAEALAKYCYSVYTRTQDLADQVKDSKVSPVYCMGGFPPSISRYMGMIWLPQLLYPDTAKYDMYTEAAKFYELFYHCKLTQEQYNALVANSLGKQ